MAGLSKESGKIIKWMVKESSPGPMVENMKENILKTRKQVREHFIGLMEDVT